ncbi:LUD domain-containing protein [Pseudoxanthobacter sp.]|uniref:LutC/YkgG family protein n=1 Tax=Pseudoxanthobacter sp. TaxID=1925742 RepID=UPI002FE06342
MSEARSAILARIGAALADVPPDAPAAEVPRAFRRTGTLAAEARTALFAGRAAHYKVAVSRCPPGEAAAAAGRILAARGLRRLVVPADFPADRLPPGVEAVPDTALSNDAIAATEGALTLCCVAIAETGTIVLDHGAAQGRRALTLLPDYHLCLVDAGRIVELVPEAVAALEPSVKAGRPLTFISGPSATSDIELNRVEGVHGPRTLDVLIIG